MSKIIVYNTDARQKLADGVAKLSNAVVTTLGPFGRNVIIEKENVLFFKIWNESVEQRFLLHQNFICFSTCPPSENMIKFYVLTFQD